MSILQWVRTCKSKNVIRRAVFLHLRKRPAEIFSTEERFPARVSRQCRKSLLRSSIAAEVARTCCAIISRLSVQARVLRCTARREGLQAPNIHGIDRDVILHRRRSGRSQRRLVVVPGLADSIAEINQRFFLLDFSERLHGGLQRQQLPIGTKRVVIRVVGRERAARFPCPLRPPLIPPPKPPP